MAQTYIGYSPDVEVLGEDEERLTAEILEIMANTNRGPSSVIATPCATPMPKAMGS
ncbi:hypothetical protein [Sphingomonas sp. SFZ2018-12]|uniref:hypothetical protein n=1 Tax=Sphingomonas sp. SFZ2018-12 TaxID=2683197 RepID=UPI001F10328E|nr:hypothetical protein [Sphingomonas sp. SFZ2018-12]